ncbi:MAG: cell envelope integrity EipB family protein [Hansschlegelia sp.]
MIIPFRIAAAGALALLALAEPAFAAAPLVAHRAVYELKLRSTRGSTQVEQVRGRIVYEFKGDSCGGYALNFRQVTEIASEGGDTNVSDLRSETWEDGAAKTFRFAAQNFLNQKLDRDTDGHAERAPEAVKVTTTKPEMTSNAFDKETLFPTEHLIRIIEAGQRGESLLEARVYDGSEAGDKSFDTLSVIGKRSDEPEIGLEAPAQAKELVGQAHWPVTISYFEHDKAENGERTPDYEMSFELYANGVSRALRIDYGEFILDGDLKELQFLPASKTCQ